MEFAKNMKEMIQNDINGNDKRNNVDSDDPDYVSEASGVFLVRYSQKENCRILTLLDNDEQAKNFIIREHVRILIIEFCCYICSSLLILMMFCFVLFYLFVIDIST